MDRRAFLAAAPAVAISASLSSAALAKTPSDPVTRYWAAEAGYNAGTVSEDDYSAALDELDFWEPPTLHDFLRKFEAAYQDGSNPNRERSEIIMAQAKRLLGEASHGA